MNWVDAKCNKCGLQREVILFVEPTKPQSALRCPRCGSADVQEVRVDCEKFNEALS